jgi:hypothetical protein
MAVAPLSERLVEPFIATTMPTIRMEASRIRPTYLTMP